MFIKIGEMSKINNIYKVCRNVIALIFAIAVAAACQKEEQMPKGGFPINITTVAERVSQFSKTSVNNDLSISWTSGDKLLMLAQTSSNATASTVLDLKEEDAGSKKATFIGTVETPQVPATCYFAYPANASATTINASAGTVSFNYSAQDGSHNPFLVSQAVTYNSSGIECTLNHIGGVLQITVPAGVQSLEIQGNNNEKLSGYTYNLINPNNSSIDDSALPQIILPTSADGGTYYVNMPPVHFEKGFTIIFNGPDGKKMYKSFNYTSGGCNFSQELKGTLIAINVDSFEPYSFAFNPEVSHTYDGAGTLTGSKATISGLTLQGVPQSLVTSYTAQLTNKDGKVVRTYSGTSVPASLTMDVANNWPYLPQGVYTLAQTVTTIYGSTDYTDNVTVGAPTLTATGEAKTSYSYYLAGEIDKANGCDNATIYDITVGARISEAILGNGNYSSLKPQAQYKLDNGTFTDVTNITTTLSSHNFGNVGSQSWSSHTISGKVTFDGGVSAEANTTVQITGLPYSLTFNKNTAGWSIYNYEWASNGYLNLNSNKNDSSRGYAVSPKFNIPNNIKCNYSVYAYYYCSLVGSGSCTIWIEPTSSSSIKSTLSSGHYKSDPKIALPITADFDNNSGQCTFTPNLPFLNISHNLSSATWQTRYVCVKSVTLTYSN